MLALRLPAELIAAVDKKRGDTARTAWIEQALREKLETPKHSQSVR